ncbi:hypothetical protein [Nocardiopsis coralliicola]
MCGADEVGRYRVAAMPVAGSEFVMCGNCEAVWEDGEAIEREQARELRDYLEEWTLHPWWDELRWVRVPAVEEPPE